jgi:hypothetical protein
MSRAVCCLSDTAAGTAWRAYGTERSTQHAVRSPRCGVNYTATNVKRQHAARSTQHEVAIAYAEVSVVHVKRYT